MATSFAFGEKASAHRDRSRSKINVKIELFMFSENRPTSELTYSVAVGPVRALV